MPATLHEKILHTTALYDKAAILLEQKRAADPDNVKILWQLAENSRQQGRIDTATDYCQQILALEPEHQPAHDLQAIFHEKESQLDLTEARSVPFIRRMNFLSLDEQQLIWDYIRQGRDQFIPSKVTSGEPDFRRSQVIYTKKDTKLKKIKTWFIPKIIVLAQQKLEYFKLLGLELGKKELQLTWHGNNHYFKTHTDISYTDKKEDIKKKG